MSLTKHIYPAVIRITDSVTQRVQVLIKAELQENGKVVSTSEWETFWKPSEIRQAKSYLSRSNPQAVEQLKELWWPS